MKLGKIIDPQFNSVLSKLVFPDATSDLPMVARFKLKKIFKKVSEEAQLFNETRQEFLKSLADKDESGNPILDEIDVPSVKDGQMEKNDDGTLKTVKQKQYRLSHEALAEFNTKYHALIESDVELPTLRLHELGEKNGLAVVDLIALDELISE